MVKHMNYRLMTQIGNRDVNEDYAKVAALPNGGSCFVLCDGLGGHGKGEVASELVTNSLIQHFLNNPALSRENVASALEAAQAELLDLQSRENMRAAMKTTAVLLLTDQQSAIWAHIGDSRLYLFHKNKIVLRTTDHSVPQMLVLVGEIKEKQMRFHPDRNRLLRVMGAEWSSQRYEISEPRPLTECQAFLLCSDGFWEFIQEKPMCKLLKGSTNADEWMQRMTAEVQKNGQQADMDNHTAIAVML